MRSVDDILKDLSLQWSDLSKSQQQNLGLQIAGRYQLSRFLTLLDQFSEAQKASTTALNSYNSAYSENETYLDSYEAKINKMKNSFTEASIALQKSFLGDGIQIFAASVTTMIKGITSLIDNVGLLPLAFATTGIATIALTGNFGKMMSMSGNLMKVIMAMPFGMKAVDAALVSTGIKTKALSVQNKLASISFTQLRTAAISSLTPIASFALPVAGFLALGFAIQKITEAYMKNKEASEKAKQALDNEQKSYSDNKKKIGEMVNEYERLSNARKDGKLDNSSEERYVELQNELGKLLPSVVQSTDAKGNSILKSTENIKDQIDVLEELIELEKERKRLEAPDNIKSNSDKINNDLFGLDKSLQYEYDSAKKMEDMFRRKAKDAQEEGKSKERISFFEKEANKWASERKQLEIEIGNLQSKNASSIKTILGDTKLNSKLKQDVSTLMSQLSFKGKDSSEIDTLVKNIGDAVDKLNKAKPDSQGYKDAKNDLKELLNIYGEGKITVQDFIDILSQEKKEKQANKEAKQQLLDLEKMSTEEVIKNANALRINTDETEDNTDATDENTASQQKNISVSEQLAGITNDNISSLQESIGVYRLLSDEENLSADKKQMLANAVANLSDQFPYLLKNGKLRIDQVQREVESSDILLKALDRVTSGTASAEETKTTYAMLGTKNRLEILAKEINAMDQMMKAYQEAAQNFYKDNRNAEGEAAQMALSFQIGLQNKQGKSYASIQSEINNLIPKLDSYAGKLADVTNYNGQYYKSAENAKKATDKQAKSTKDASKATEKSTYVADKYAQSLEKISAALEKQHSIQSKFPEWSQEYRNSLNEELKLLKEKKSVLEAQSKELQNQIRSGNIIKTGVTTTKSTSSPSSKVTGSSTQDIVWNFFKSKGLSDTAVAGIMGNLQQESNFSTTAMGPQTKYGRAYGIAQWLGGRQTNLKKYAASLGKSYSDLEVQLNFLWQELNGAENKTLKYLQSNSGSSASTLAAGFERLFERSGGSAVGKRQGYANNIYSKYSGKTVSTTNVTNTSKEVAENLSSLDDAKSKLVGINTELVKVNDEIDNIEQIKLIESKANDYEHLIEGVDRSIQKSQSVMKQYTSTSAEYRKELDLQASKLKYKQSLLHKEAEFLRAQIKSGKLSDALVAEYTDRVSELSLRWWDVEESLDNVIVSNINSILEQTAEKIDDLDFIISSSEATMEQYNDTSEEYKKELLTQGDALKIKSQLIKEDIELLKEQIANQKLSKQQVAEYQEKIEDLTSELYNLNSATKELDNKVFDWEFRIQDKSINDIMSKVDFIDYKISLLSDDVGYEIKSGLFTEMADQLANVNIQLEQAIQKTIALRTQAGVEGKDTTSINERLQSLLSQRQSNMQKMQQNYQNMLNNVHDAEQKIKDAEQDALKEAHDDFTKQLNESEKRIDKFQQIIDNVNNSLELLSVSDFDKKQQLVGEALSANKQKASQIIEEFNKLRQTTVYSEDDSEELRNKLNQLKQQLADTNKQTIEYVKSLEQIRFDALTYGMQKASAEFDRLSSRLKSNLDLLDGGLLSGTSLDFNFTIPTGNKLDLSSLISDPISDVETTEIKIQDIRSSSYGEQIRMAEDLYNNLSQQAANYHAVMIEAETEFQNTIKQLLEESDKKIADAKNKNKEEETKEKEKSEKDKQATQSKYNEEERIKLETHIQDLQNTMSKALNAYSQQYATQWDGILSILDSKISQAKSKLNQLLSIVNEANNAAIKPPSSSSAKSVPKYAKGTEGHQGGLAIVGDGGGRELILTPNGKVLLSPDSSTLMSLPKGTHVISHKETEKLLTKSSIPAYANGTHPEASSKEEFDRWVQEALDGTDGGRGSFYWNGGLYTVHDRDLIDRMNNASQIPGYHDTPSSWNPYGNSGEGIPEIPKTQEEIEAEEIRKITARKPLVYSNEFVEKYDPYNKDGSKYEKDRIIKQEVIQKLQDKLDEAEQNNNTNEIKKLSAQILEEQNKVAKEDTLFIIESLNDLNKQKEKNAKETKDELYKMLEDEDLTEDTITKIQEEIMKLDDEISNSLKERKQLVQQLFDYEQQQRDKVLDDFKNIQKEIEYDFDIINILNPSDIQTNIDYLKLMSKNAINYTNELKKQKQELEKQLPLYEAGSYEWNLINEKVKEYGDLIKQAYQEQAKYQKDLVSKQFEQQILDIEKSLFDGKTQDQARKELENKRKEQDKYIDGLEKELEIGKLMSWVKKEGLSLSREQLNIINTTGKIEKEKFERLKKELEIQQLQIKLDNLRNQKNIQQLKKNKDGTWDFYYVADEDAIAETEQALKDKQLEMINWEKDTAYNAEQERLDEKAQYLDELRKTTEKALNGEYVSFDEFSKAMSSLNSTFLNGMTDETKLQWESMFTSVESNIGNMLNAYQSYVNNIKQLAEEAKIAIQEMMIAQDIFDNRKVYTNNEIAMMTDEQRKTILKDPNSYVEYKGKEIAASDILNMSEDELKAKYGYANGGLSTTTGLHWLDGTLAKPELVLNPNDTQNLLKAVNLTEKLGNLTKIPDFSKILTKTKETMSQVFQISKLEFPNVTSSDEIQDAIKNLPRIALTKARGV